MKEIALKFLAIFDFNVFMLDFLEDFYWISIIFFVFSWISLEIFVEFERILATFQEFLERFGFFGAIFNESLSSQFFFVEDEWCPSWILSCSKIIEKLCSFLNLRHFPWSLLRGMCLAINSSKRRDLENIVEFSWITWRTVLQVFLHAHKFTFIDTFWLLIDIIH